MNAPTLNLRAQPPSTNNMSVRYEHLPAPVVPKLLKKIALNGLNFKFEIFFAYGAYLRRLMHNNHNW